MATRLQEMVEQLTMENNWNIEYTIDVEPEKLAKEISERFRGVVNDAMVEMIPIVQNNLREFQAKMRSADAARRQIEVN